MDSRLQRLFACDCADRAFTKERFFGREPDPRSVAAVSVARMFASGLATRDELFAAYSAAQSLHRYSAAAEQSALYSAYTAADYCAADYAADYSADYSSEEREWQVSRAVELAKEVAK